ncbi:MAG: aminoglycoside phosphotransferase family protein [Propionibacteriaceae bacterium]|nr:aminoglycoside phosphotransferase family protein [Propionibacteriaceae bacterium]
MDGLPRLVEDTFRRWHLTPVGEVIVNPASRVYPVLDADGVRRACKFSFVENDNVGEIPTLSLWGGRHAVELVRADPRRGILLLEWLDGDLEQHGDADEATCTVAGLYRRLHRRAAPQLPDGHAFVRRWLGELEGLGRAVPAPPRFVDWALRAGRDLAAEPGTHVVHGDLHYLNVMARDDDWVAIDPKGYNAAPEYEVAPLLWNRWADLEATGDVGEAIRDRFYAAVDTAELDERIARDWVVVRCAINLGWAVQDGSAESRQPDWHASVTRQVTILKAMQAVEA